MSNKFIKLTDFLKLEIKPFILGAFLSRTMEETIDGNKMFYTYSAFKSSKFVYRDDFNLISYANRYIEKLNKESGYYNWQIKKASKTNVDVRFYILNDLNITRSMFYKIIFQKIVSSPFVMEEGLTEPKKSFIRGFIELRGSVDTTMKLIAQDYFYNSNIELKKAQILTDMMDIPLSYANFNMRNLQPQFVGGENMRNAQFRINAYFYANKVGFINDYKAQIFENAYHIQKKKIIDCITYYFVDLPKTRNDDVTFIKMINFFTNNIYQKQLNTQAIQQYRDKLGFNNEPTAKATRNASIIKLFNEITEDKCAICGTTATYTNPITGRQQFEIHHMISFKNSADLDNIANLVKLCPTCHGKLGKGSATKEEQLKAILKILHEHQEIFEFTSSYLGIDDICDLANKIWKLLG